MRYLQLVLVLAIACKSTSEPRPAPNTPTPGAPAPTPSAPTAAAGGSEGCVELMSCYGKCPGLTADCTGACDALGTAPARAANAEVFRCIAQAGCADEACITTNCATQLQTCVGTAGASVAAAEPAAAEPAAAQPSAAPSALPPVSDAEFIFRGQDGLDYVPELTVAAQGVPVSLDGTWADSRHNFTLELHGASYTVSDQGSGPSGSAATSESGTWSLAGTIFTVTPTRVELHTTNGLHQDDEQTATDPPRAWTLVGATLQYSRFNDATHAVYQVDGLLLSGPAPSWDAVGAFDHTLRRAR